MSKNIAFVLAGGTDASFQMNIPKQFVSVFNRPLVVYTLEIFQSHPEIDAIGVACLDGWQEMVKTYAKQFNITKLKWILTGGRSGQETSYKIVRELAEECSGDDIMILHDAIRPMVSDEIISDSIRTCKAHSIGVAAINSMDAIMTSVDGETGDNSIDRYEIMKIQTPQAYHYSLLKEAHKKAQIKQVTGQWETSSMLSQIGEKIYLSKGSDLNFKINRIEDITMFKALYQLKKEEGNV